MPTYKPPASSSDLPPLAPSSVSSASSAVNSPPPAFSPRSCSGQSSVVGCLPAAPTSDLRHPTSDFSRSSVLRPPSSALFGCFTRKERWGLSLRGWLLLLSSVLCLSGIVFFGIHPFLAIDAPVGAKILVMEGWIPESAVRHTAELFRTRSFHRIYTVGGAVQNPDEDVDSGYTYAQLGASRLRKAGVSKSLLEAVPARILERDRTYGSAAALQQHFARNGVTISSLNVVTVGAHARRSRLLFQKAFGPGVDIGILAMPNLEYSDKHWWRYSEGVREVISETAAYLYVRLFFWPTLPQND